MKNNIKNYIEEIVNTMKELHGLIYSDDKHASQYLGLCSEALISICEAIGEEGTQQLQISIDDYVRLLTNQKLPLIKGGLKLLNLSLEQVLLDIKRIKVTYKVVFFPYNASMWDSLESIYMVCRDDSCCECIVVPIPYYKINRITNELEYTYEGELFPGDIPIVHYTNYSIERDEPDIAYIHNPYDETNLVTRVHSDYFSYQLKKNVRTLVYVPYYASAENHVLPNYKLEFSAYKHVDYIVLQSEFYKEQFKNTPYYEKVLPLGSPKFDRVLNMCKNPIERPIEWEKSIQGKKTIFLNISIASLLRYEERVLNKLRTIFESINIEEFAVIWRPHPLLMSTINAMKPELKKEYEELVEFYVDKGVGVFDKTPDCTRTIAFCDAYIGCSVSSIVTLFQAVGKPIFMLNYAYDFRMEAYALPVRQVQKISDGYILSIDGKGSLFKTDEEFKVIKEIDVLADENVDFNIYNYFTVNNDNVYTTTISEGELNCYNIQTNQCNEVNKEKMMGYGKVVSYKDKVFYLPWIGAVDIACYDTNTKKFNYHKECISEFLRVQDDNISSVTVLDFFQVRNLLYMISPKSAYVLVFDMNTREHYFLQIGKEGFSAILIEDKRMWLAGAISGDIIEYDLKNNKTKKYKIPHDFRRNQKVPQGGGFHINIIKMNNTIITTPYYSNSIMKINLQTGRVTAITNDFTMKYFEESYLLPTCLFSCKYFGKEILFSRWFDGKLARLNIESEEFQEFNFDTSYVDFSKLNQQKQERLKSALMVDEAFCYTHKEFLEVLKKPQRIEKNNRLANNLNGNCGTQIHRSIIKLYQSEKK